MFASGDAFGVTVGTKPGQRFIKVTGAGCGGVVAIGATMIGQGVVA